ncbi:MAG: membrane protein insertion efficiency factor YidD [Planctomycetota bacterium]|jgi:putative membrane protein insertion efficiency factor
MCRDVHHSPVRDSGAAQSASALPGASLAARLVRMPFVYLILAYRFAIRPFLIGSCKFYPTCSQYALEALETHGLLRGARLAAWRILRCHPFTAGGIDPVPGPPEKEKTT